MGILRRRRPWLLLMVLMGLRCCAAALVDGLFVLERGLARVKLWRGGRLSFHSRLLAVM